MPRCLDCGEVLASERRVFCTPCSTNENRREAKGLAEAAARVQRARAGGNVDLPLAVWIRMRAAAGTILPILVHGAALGLVLVALAVIWPACPARGRGATHSGSITRLLSVPEVAEPPAAIKGTPAPE